MDTAQDPKKKVRHPDRVTLTAEALSRLTEMLNQLDGHLKGSRVTKSDLASFLVLSRSSQLSDQEVEQLKRQHFDEVRFAQWALRQLKAAKAEGKTLSLAEVMQQGQALQSVSETRAVSPKTREKIQGS